MIQFTIYNTNLQYIHIYPRVCRRITAKGLVNNDNDSMGGIHWTCFIKKIIIHTSLTRLVVSQIYFYFNDYLNQ